MALINVASREIHCKIVYYGTGFCGKTTNLQYIYGRAPTTARGDLLTINTESERTRVAVLNGVDGVVFVVDSSPEKLDENFASLIELETNVRHLGKDLG